MTVTRPSTSSGAGGSEVEPRPDLVTITVDGFEVHVPKGTLVIRAAELIGVQIPRFCDHPLLDPVGACRQCLVEVEGQPKPLASCTTTVTDGMVVKTQLTSAVADKAQRGVMELLLINHPLDCPVCDKGGECPLQNQAMSNGRGETRFHGVKRTFPKPINISSQVLLDRERCVLCARCTRFSAQVAGDPFIEMLERGALQQVGIYEAQPFQSYFSGNTVQICPVGALTGAAYRFRSRPFDLVSSPGVCEHCASGCAIRTDHRRGKVLRRLAGDDPQVNEEWNCDKGRWAFQYATAQDRLTHPQVRDESGNLVPTSWAEALDIAARGLAAARGAAGVLVGGRATLEDAYGYAKFARVALNSNDVDFRARPHSAEEESFLAAHVAGSGLGVTYEDLERASTVLLVGLEPEEESPIVFLRLRKAVRRGTLAVHAVAPFAGRGLEKLSASVVPTAPGTEAEVLDALRGSDERVADLAAALRTDGAVILVGEALAAVPGALSAVARLAEATGARLAWVPRRAGERGALEAGALPAVLPGGRPVADAAARVDAATAWGVAGLPADGGRNTAGILDAVHTGDVRALVVGGVDPYDLPDPTAALAALDAAPFVVSLELRESAVTERADVVLPVAAVVEKAGTFLDWEGRHRPFAEVLRDAGALPDVRVLHVLAEEMGVELGLPDVESARAEIGELGTWDGDRASFEPVPAPAPAALASGEAVLATWPLLLDGGRLQDDEPHLAGTARAAVARLSPATATALGVADGDTVTVATGHGEVAAPAAVTDMPDGVVWLPTNSGGVRVRRDPRGRPRHEGPDRRRVPRGAAGRRSVTSTVLASPEVPGFGQDVWWLVLGKAVAIFVFLVLMTLFTIYAERRVVGRMQHRIGPNRVGPAGLLQSLADGIKLALKEDIIPKAADKAVFVLAPILSTGPAFLAFAVIPFGPQVTVFGERTALQLTDLPVAVLYVLAAASVGIYGIVLGGWSSGSTYPLLGGLRSSAQMISYEVAMALSFVGVFLYAGSMSTSEIVAAQGDYWYAVLLAPSFVIYLISMVGEVNRAPFDLPEAEGELVGGFHTEYSSLKFALFFLAEYINMVTVSALATTLFLGGWRAPWPLSVWDGANQGWWPVLWFTAKVFLFLFVFIWLRGTLPRLRYDQFMKLGWKVLIPVALGWLLLVATVRAVNQEYELDTRQVLIYGGLAAVALIALTFAWDLVAARGVDEEAPVEEPAWDPMAGGHPVPPLPGQQLPELTAVGAPSDHDRSTPTQQEDEL